MNDISGFLQAIRTGAYIVGGGVGAFTLYRWGLSVYDDMYSRWLARRQDLATLKAAEQQRKLHDIRPISADERVSPSFRSTRRVSMPMMI